MRTAAARRRGHPGAEDAAGAPRSRAAPRRRPCARPWRPTVAVLSL